MTNNDELYDKVMAHIEADSELYNKVMAEVKALHDVRNVLHLGSSISDTYGALTASTDNLQAALLRHSEATKGVDTDGAEILRKTDK